MSLTVEQLFTDARSHNRFEPDSAPEDKLRQLYELMKWGPTTANSTPARIVFVRSSAAKAKLVECVSAGNAEKTKNAPVVAIVGMDMEFYDKLPRLYPAANARAWFAGKPEHIATTALRNSSLQGGYFILAARAVGLDAGPMSGFDNAKVDAAFFAGTSIKSNFICALGRGKPEALYPRGPRLDFDEACRFD